MINRKALGVFLSVTFGLTLIMIFLAKAKGFTLYDVPSIYSQLIVASCMFFPAIGALLTQIFVVKKPLKELGFRFGPWTMYVVSYFCILLIFVLNYGIVWLFFLKPDWTLLSFINQYADLFKDLSLPFPAPYMILLLTFVTFFTAPIMNMIPSLGEEIGWRGFLLPTLEPAGKIKAMVISGIIWALWHTPMILLLGFGYGKQAWPGVLLHFVMITSLGIWMGYIWLSTRSTIFAAFIHSVINAHAYGVLTVLFVSENKLLIGPVGIIGASLCLFLGLATLFIARQHQRSCV